MSGNYQSDNCSLPEYELEEGDALRELDIADLINNTSALCVLSCDESRVEEKFVNLFLGHCRPLDNDVRNAVSVIL